MIPDAGLEFMEENPCLAIINSRHMSQRQTRSTFTDAGLTKQSYLIFVVLLLLRLFVLMLATLKFEERIIFISFGRVVPKSVAYFTTYLKSLLLTIRLEIHWENT